MLRFETACLEGIASVKLPVRALWHHRCAYRCHGIELKGQG
jgi:hypothetical protein